MALRQTADILRAVSNKTSAFLARYGGDEFVIILPDGQAEEADKMILRIKKALEVIDETTSIPFELSISAGYAVSNSLEAGEMATLLKAADASMYTDKTAFYAGQTERGRF